MRAASGFAAAALLLSGFAACGADWPMRLYDAHRGGVSPERLTAGLQRIWSFQPPSPPAPAWAESPAENDFWQRFMNLKPRQNFDNCFDVAVAGGRVYFGSSRDGVLTCLSAQNGALQWEFYSGGPIRFAPQVSDGKVYFGSDDGFVYCLDAADGAQLWKERAGPDASMIWGNRQMISLWPVRTSVLVVNGYVYWSAGLFPEKGIFLCKRRAADGGGGWKVNAVKPHQGYLLANSGRLFVPSGKAYPEVYSLSTGAHLSSIKSSTRDGGCWALLSPSGDDFWFGSSYSSSGSLMGSYDAGNGSYLGGIAGADSMIADTNFIYYVTDSDAVKLRRSDNESVWSTPVACPTALIKAGDMVFCGGSNRVVALDDTTGSVLWQGAVSGKVYGLAVADSRLYVSTDNGVIAVFSADGPAVSNNGGPLVLSSTEALLRGYLVSTGGAPTSVSVRWSEASDSGWTHTNTLGVCDEGALSVTVSGLAPDSAYRYRFYASNSFGTAFAPDEYSFITGELSISATDPVAGEEAPDPGVITIARPAETTNVALTVRLRVAGSALPGVDYDEIPSEFVIPAGETQAVVTVVPVDDMIMNESNETVEVSIEPGPFLASGSTATVVIADNDNLITGRYRQRMNIRVAGYAGSETLQGFPVLVKLSEALPGFSYSQFAGRHGGDLRFINDSMTAMLNYEIEEWNTNGTSLIWVELPRIQGTDTAFRAYWGNPAFTNALPCTQNGAVWRNGFSAVWHLNEHSGLRTDATRNGLDGTPVYGTGYDAGIVGASAAFDGLDDYISVPSLPVGNITTYQGWTMEGWIKPGDLSALSYPTVLSFGRWGASLGLDKSSMRLESWLNNSGDVARSTDSVRNNVWAYIVMTYDSAGRHFYINGRFDSDGTAPEIQTGYGTDYKIGAAADDENRAYSKFSGLIDELRLSKISRSPDWVRASWLNVVSNSVFLDYGTVRSDTDQDGIEDGWERNRFGNLTTAGRGTDNDGDGFPDYAEYVADTDPNTASSALKVTAVKLKPAGHLQIIWQSSGDRTYCVETASNLSSRVWVPVLTNLPGSSPQNSAEFVMESNRYYRVTTVAAGSDIL